MSSGGVVKNFSFKNSIISNLTSSNKKYLVLYSGNKFENFTIAHGYKTAADKLVKKLCSARIGAPDDSMVYPIIFLNFHYLELLLKIYLEKLIKHKQIKTCGTIPGIPSKAERCIRVSHDLLEIYGHIFSLVNHDKLHGNKEFAELKGPFEELNEIGIENLRLRYWSEGSFLTAAQKWVYIEEANETFSSIGFFLESSIRDVCFDYCELKEFKDVVKKEYEYIKNETVKFVEKNVANLTAPILAGLNKQNLEVLVCSSYFGNHDPMNCGRLDFYKDWSEEKLTHKLKERICYLPDAIENIEKHIRFIESKIQSKK